MHMTLFTDYNFISILRKYENLSVWNPVLLTITGYLIRVNYSNVLSFIKSHLGRVPRMTYSSHFKPKVLRKVFVSLGNSNKRKFCNTFFNCPGASQTKSKKLKAEEKIKYNLSTYFRNHHSMKPLYWRKYINIKLVTLAFKITHLTFSRFVI